MRDRRIARRPAPPLVQALDGLWLASAFGGLCVTLLLAIGPDDVFDELRQIAPAVLVMGALGFIGSFFVQCARTRAAPLLHIPANGLLLRSWRPRKRRAPVIKDGEQQSRQEDDRRYETLFQLFPDAVALIDPDTTFAVEFNERMCDLLGYSQEELKKIPMSDYRAFDTQEETKVHIRRILARGSDLVRTVLRTKQGTLRRVICDLRVIDLDGRELLYLVIRDVTNIVEATTELRALNATLENRIAARTAQLRQESWDRQALERTLQSERDLHERILDASATAIVVVGTDGAIRLTNRQAQEILGLPADRLVGRTCSEVADEIADHTGTPLSDHDLPVERVRQIGAPVWGQELRISRPDGSRRLISVSATPIFDADGHIGDIVCSFDDVTRERSLTESLYTVNQRLTALLTALPDVVFILDGNGVYLEILGGRPDLLYADASLLLGRSVKAILPAHVSVPLLDLLQACLADGQTRTFDYGLTVAAGNRRFEARIAPIYGAQQQPETVAVVARDVTDRYEVEQSLIMAKAAADEANVAKSRFLAAMSHELRTPLNAILGFTEVLMIKTETAAGFQRPLEIIQNAGWELLQLIDDILDLSKIEAGKAQLEEGPFDLTDVVQGTVALLQPQAEKKKLSLSCVLDGTIPTALFGDPRRIRQILMNIVGNAIKYTQQGSVHLSVEPVPSLAAAPQETTDIHLLFRVTDTGVGIPPDRVDSIFQMFERGDDELTRDIAGTGMGLSISKRLVEMMGGNIWLESAIGLGSRFFFTVQLQRSDPSAPSTVLEEGQERVSPQRPAHILIIEDDAFSRQLLETVLEQHAYRLSAVEDGEAALALMKKTPFDLVLLDIQLPGIHGLDLATMIRAGDTALPRQTPIIATTAFAMAGDRDRFMAAGLSDYLSKPINIMDTLDMVQRHLTDHADQRDRPSFTDCIP